ncbi:MAG: ATP-binding protein [Rubrivivax sp.]
MSAAAPPPPDDELSAQRLLQRARHWLWLALVPLVLLVLVLAAWQAQLQWRRVLDGALAEVRSQRHAFDALVRDAEHHVADLQRWAQQEALRGGGEPAPAITAALQPQPDDGGRVTGHTLDELPGVLRQGMGQLLWPGAAAPAPEWVRRAEAMSAVMEIAQQRGDALSRSFFFGWPEVHLLVYPWVPLSALQRERAVAADVRAVVGAWKADERVQLAMPERNSTRSPFWLVPRGGGDGPPAVLVHAAPLIVADEVRGVLGTELKTSAMRLLLERLPGEPWQAWLVDAAGRVLAARDAEALPAGVDAAQVARAARAGQAVGSGGQQLVAVPLAGPSWTLVLAAPQGAVLGAALPHVLPYTLIVGGLLLAWVAAQMVMRQRLVAPLVEIFDYLRRLSVDPAAPEPALGARWRPWVQVVTHTFAAMRRAAQGERRAQALKSAIVDHAQTAVLVADEDDRLVEINPAAEAMLGVERQAALGRTVRELVCPPRFRDAYDRARRRMQDGDPDQLLGRRLERLAQRADGREFPVEVVMWMTRVDGTAYHTASMTDLTDARATAEVIARQRDALRQSEKLSAMGGLLAGVAHELNNPLAIVMGRASLLEDKTAGTPLHDDVRRIRDAADRCGRIVRTFLNMARQRPAERGEVQLNDVVRAAADMLGYTLRSHGIELELRLDDTLPIVPADGDQVGQVVLNLIVNAQQALAGHEGLRRIGVATGVDAASDQAWLRVADSGPGVPEALHGSVFDPFFTTKTEGMGTGVGLSVSRSIAREHGGELLLEPPQPGGGAVFRLRLPLHPPTPSHHDDRAAATP